MSALDEETAAVLFKPLDINKAGVFGEISLISDGVALMCRPVAIRVRR